jgi:hypothetical protein
MVAAYAIEDATGESDTEDGAGGADKDVNNEGGLLRVAEHSLDVVGDPVLHPRDDQEEARQSDHCSHVTAVRQNVANLLAERVVCRLFSRVLHVRLVDQVEEVLFLVLDHFLRSAWAAFFFFFLFLFPLGSTCYDLSRDLEVLGRDEGDVDGDGHEHDHLQEERELPGGAKGNYHRRQQVACHHTARSGHHQRRDPGRFFFGEGVRVTPHRCEDADEDLEDPGQEARDSHNFEAPARQGEANNDHALEDDAGEQDQLHGHFLVNWHRDQAPGHFAQVDERAEGTYLQVAEFVVFLERCGECGQDSVVKDADEVHDEEEPKGVDDLAPTCFCLFGYLRARFFVG